MTLRQYAGILTLLVFASPPAAFAQSWKGTYANGGLVKALKDHGLSKKAAKAKADELVKTAKKALESAHKGLKDGKYSYDMYQDLVVGKDGLPPNCFGNVCKGGAQRWEPSAKQLVQWLNANGYQESNSECECGLEKLATWVVTVTFKDGLGERSQDVPIHIAEQLEDCSWRSTMGGLGAVVHESPGQLWDKRSVEVLAKGWMGAGITFVSAKATVKYYSKAHQRNDYHGKPNGPLDCPKPKPKPAEDEEEEDDSEGG